MRISDWSSDVCSSDLSRTKRSLGQDICPCLCDSTDSRWFIGRPLAIIGPIRNHLASSHTSAAPPATIRYQAKGAKPCRVTTPTNQRITSSATMNETTKPTANASQSLIVSEHGRAAGWERGGQYG